jgi:drug/metabolite transporter (DMT)-like permease
MSDRLSFAQILLLCTYAVGMTCGQLLFKFASYQLQTDLPLGQRMFGLLHNGFFLGAIALYGALTVLWVWVLSFTPLSRAYLFVALAFALTPALGAYTFAEPVSYRMLAGLVLVLGGLVLVAG